MASVPIVIGFQSLVKTALNTIKLKTCLVSDGSREIHIVIPRAAKERQKFHKGDYIETDIDVNKHKHKTTNTEPGAGAAGLESP